MGAENDKRRRGFTLIEMSIVLVIIGLIVGGILVGQDLVRSAGVRAQISQIERYHTALNTFKGKFNALPGDMNSQTALQFSFIARGTSPGQGDGNGVIEGYYSSGGANGTYPTRGETAVFWVDLTSAGLIDSAFSTASESVSYISTNCLSGSQLDAYFPSAKLGGANYVFVYSWNQVNYFDLSVPGDANPFCIRDGAAETNPGLTVRQAYHIDLKMDDGLPQAGRVAAHYLKAGVDWAGAKAGVWPNYSPTTAATAGSAVTCYDNSTASSGTPGVAGNPQHYSIEKNSGAGVNCALSFQFQ